MSWIILHTTHVNLVYIHNISIMLSHSHTHTHTHTRTHTRTHTEQWRTCVLVKREKGEKKPPTCCLQGGRWGRMSPGGWEGVHGYIPTHTAVQGPSLSATYCPHCQLAAGVCAFKALNQLTVGGSVLEHTLSVPAWLSADKTLPGGLSR